MIAISPEPGWLHPLAWLAISGPHLLPPPQEQVGAGRRGCAGILSGAPSPDCGVWNSPDSPAPFSEPGPCHLTLNRTLTSDTCPVCSFLRRPTLLQTGHPAQHSASKFGLHSTRHTFPEHLSGL